MGGNPIQARMQTIVTTTPVETPSTSETSKTEPTPQKGGMHGFSATNPAENNSTRKQTSEISKNLLSGKPDITNQNSRKPLSKGRTVTTVSKKNLNNQNTRTNKEALSRLPPPPKPPRKPTNHPQTSSLSTSQAPPKPPRRPTKHSQTSTLATKISSTNEVTKSTSTQSKSESPATFNLKEAKQLIGKYDQFHKPPVDLSKDKKTIVYQTSSKPGEGTEVHYDEKENAFVDAEGNKVEVPLNDKGNPILFNKKGTQIPCDKTGRPDPKGFPKERPGLSQKAQEKLYKGCPKNTSTKKREEFLTELSKHLDNIPTIETKKGESKPVTSFDDLFKANPKLKQLYKDAVKEEKNSKEFRDAVMAEASEKQETNPCPGMKMVMYVGGPSAAGKSFTRGAFVEEVRNQMQAESGNEENSTVGGADSYVVSVDGGIDREMCQMRQMVLQSALAKGYAGIEDLNDVKTSVKGNVKKAAMTEDNNMHVVIPATFTSNLHKFPGMCRNLSQKKNVYQVFAEVRSDHSARGINPEEADESFRQTILYNGESRAYNLDKEYDSGISMNKRNLPCESKVYQPEHFDKGVWASDRAKDVFKRVGSSKRSLILTNHSDNMHVDAQGNQVTSNPAIKHIARREIDLWKEIEGGANKRTINEFTKRLGHSDEKSEKITEKIMEKIDNGDVKDLADFKKFLADEKAQAKLQVTSHTI